MTTCRPREGDGRADLAVDLVIEGKQVERLGQPVLVEAAVIDLGEDVRLGFGRRLGSGEVRADRVGSPGSGVNGWAHESVPGGREPGRGTRRRRVRSPGATAGPDRLETALPRLMTVPGVSDVRRPANGCDQGPVEAVGWRSERPDHVRRRARPARRRCRSRRRGRSRHRRAGCDPPPNGRPPPRPRCRPGRRARGHAGPGGSAGPLATVPGAHRCACAEPGWKRTRWSDRGCDRAAPRSAGSGRSSAAERNP